MGVLPLLLLYVLLLIINMQHAPKWMKRWKRCPSEVLNFVRDETSLSNISIAVWEGGQTDPTILLS